MSVVSSTSGSLPKENGQIQYGEHRLLGGNPKVNLTLYIWQLVAYLKNNLSWAVVSTSWNRAAGCNVSRELFVVYFTGRVFLLPCWSINPNAAICVKAPVPTSDWLGWRPAIPADCLTCKGPLCKVLIKINEESMAVKGILHRMTTQCSLYTAILNKCFF